MAADNAFGTKLMDSNLVENYGWQDKIAPCSCGYIAPKVVDLLLKYGVSRVLDLGAGNGALCSIMTDRGIDAVGVEYDEKAVEIAKSAYPTIRFYRFGVQDDPKELLRTEATFDAVVSTEVIEHLFSPHLLPQFPERVLRNNGLLVITTPYHGYLKNLALAVFGKWDSHHDPLWHGGHIKFFSRSTLTKILRDNGFEIVKFSGVGRVPYLWKSMIVTARKVSS